MYAPGSVLSGGLTILYPMEKIEINSRTERVWYMTYRLNYSLYIDMDQWMDFIGMVNEYWIPLNNVQDLDSGEIEMELE